MQKVVYSVKKVNKDERLKGVGYLSEGCLLMPQISQKGKAYIRVFEDVVEKCKRVNSDSEEHANEFSGYVTVPYTNVPIYNAKDDNYDIVDYIEVEYYVWFKYVD